MMETAQPELAQKICSLHEAVAGLSVKADAGSMKEDDFEQAIQKINQTAELHKSQIHSVQNTVQLLQDSLGEQTDTVSAHNCDIARMVEEHSKKLHSLEEEVDTVRSHADSFAEQVIAGTTTLAHQAPPSSVFEAIYSVQDLVHRTNWEQQILSAEVQTFATASSTKHSVEDLKDVYAMVASVEQRLVGIAGDLDSQQQRTENSQRTQHRLVTDLAAIVKGLEDEIHNLMGNLELQTSQTQAHASTRNNDHAAQLKQTMVLVTGTDEKLSALGEMVLNTKADTAGLREILRTLQAAQQQLSEDLLSIRLSIEDRLDSLEELASPHDQQGIEEQVKALCTMSGKLQNKVGHIQTNQETYRDPDAGTWHVELSNRVENLEKTVAAIRESTPQPERLGAAPSGHACIATVPDATSLNASRSNVHQLQNDLEQNQAVVILQDQQTEMYHLVPKLQEQVQDMSAQISDLLSLKEQVVDKEKLDGILSELETALDDIGSELDDIKARDGIQKETDATSMPVSAGKLAQYDDQFMAITTELKFLHTMVGASKHDEMQLQLEALGQRLRVLADDVEALEQRDVANKSMPTQIDALAKRVEQVQEQINNSGAQNDPGFVQHIAVRSATTFVLRPCSSELQHHAGYMQCTTYNDTAT